MNTKPIHKEHVNVTIDSDLIQKARDAGINVSETMERGLRDSLDVTDVKIVQSIDKCEFCGRKDEKASKDNDFKGLCWLWPDERWICESCLLSKSKRMCVTGGVHY